MVGGLSLKSIVATLVFLMILIVLGLILQKYPSPSDPIFGLLATLFICSFLALIVCISNIGEMVDKHKIMNETSTVNRIKLSSCPEYWRKIRDENNIGVKCSNNFNSNSVYGNLTKNGEEYAFDPNFSSSSLTDLQDEAVYDTENTTGTISNGENDKWIKEGVNSGADPNSFSMEIDLDQLNKTSNPCQLSKYFAWTEARSKCQV